MGTVYRVRREGREMALKLFRPTPEAGLHDRLRFRREFELASRLSHPGLVEVYRQGLWEGQPYFTMELVQGQNLRDFLRARPDQLQGVVARMLEALEHIHRHGIVHRDLKPENVLVQEDGQPRLLDLGLARAHRVRAQVTEPGTLLGTPQYMAPEQVRGGDLDGRVDLYAVGVMLYEVLSGRLPFEHSDLMAMLCALLNEEPEPLEGSGPLPGLVMRLLSRRPADRFQSAGELLYAWSAAFGAAREHVPEQSPLLLHPRFVGRERELERVAACTAGLVLVQGPSGAGKSRFLQEAARCLERRDRPVLSAASAPEPYGLWRSLLGPLPRGSSDEFALYEAMRGKLLRLKGERGLVLLLEDLDQVDAASLDFLTWVSSCPDLLLLASCRDDFHPRADLTLQLEPLDREESGALANSMLAYAGLTEESVGELHALTGGNPMLLVESVRTMVSFRLIQRQPEGWQLEVGRLSGSSSTRLRQALEQRVGRLRPEELELALLGAVLGPSFSFEVMQRALEISPEQLMARLGRLVEKRVLVEEASFRFPVRLLWEVLLERSVGRRDLHEKALLGLRDSSDLPRRAHHCRLAGQETQAAALLLRAAESALGVYAYRDALDMLEACRDLPPVIPPARLDELRADALDGLGRTACAVDLLESLLGHSDGRLRVMRKLGACYQRLGRLSQANQVLQQALSEAGVVLPSAGWWRCRLAFRREEAEVRRILDRLFRVHFFLRPAGWRLDSLVISLLQRSGTRFQSCILAACVLASLLPGRWLGAVRERLLLAAGLYREEPDSLSQAAFLSEAGFLLLVCNDPHNGARLAGEGVAMSERLGDGKGLTQAHEVAYVNHRYLGDLRSACRHARLARRLAQRGGSRVDLAINSLSLCLVLILQGGWREAREILDEFHGPDLDSPLALAVWLLVQSWWGLLQGEAGRALQAARHCLAHCRRYQTLLEGREARMLELCALVALSAEQPGLRPEAERKALQLAGPGPWESVVLRCLGQLHAQGGRSERALASLVAALDVAVRCGNLYEQGNSHMALSAFYQGRHPERARGHRESAVACWAEGDVLFATE